jgi:hypothetical protein
MNRRVQSSVAALCGIVTSVLTAVLLVMIELRWGHALYSFTFWFVLPAGAIGSGMVAASGYWLGARLLNYRPGRSLLALILTTSATMFFFIQWLDYSYMTVEGQALKDVISFGDFLVYTIAHTSLRFGMRGHVTGTGVDIGAGGYLFAVVQILGFLIGGFAIYAYLTSMTYCNDCRLYLNSKGIQTRYFRSAEEMQEATEKILTEMRLGRLQHSVLVHAALGTNESGSATFSSVVEVKSCKGCDKHWTKFTPNRKAGNDWKEISELSFSAFCMEPVELHRTISGTK